MADTFSPTAQRPKLLAFAEALDSRADALRRDENGDWRIKGKHGHVYACPEGYQLVALIGSPRRWTFVKQLLGFCEVTQDGDDEGALILDRLPTPKEGEAIRQALGVYKRVHQSAPSEAQLAHRAAFAEEQRRKRGFQPDLLASDNPDGL